MTDTAGDFDRDNNPVSDDPINTVDSPAPGAQSHVPGEDDSDSSIGGVVPDGSAIDHVGDSDLPGEGGLSGE